MNYASLLPVRAGRSYFSELMRFLGKIFFLLLVAASPVFAQNKKIDSLLKALPESQDTVRAKTLNLLSRQYAITGDYAKALSCAKEAEMLATQLHHKRERATAYHNIALVHQYQSRYSEALKFNQRALELRAEMVDDAGVASSYMNIGNVYKAMGEYIDALKYYILSLELAEKTKDRKGLANAYNNIGTVQKGLGKLDEALENYRRSLALHTEAKDKRNMAIVHNNLGNLYSDLGDTARSVENYLRSLELKKAIGDKLGMGRSYNNLAMIYSAQKDFDKALRYYVLAEQLANETNSNHDRASVWTNTGLVYFKKREFEKARSYLSKASALARATGVKQEAMNSNRHLSEVDSALGNFKEAYEHHKVYLLYRDSLNNEDIAARAAQAQVTYEFQKEAAADSVRDEEKAAKAQLAYDKELLRERSYTYGGIIGACFMLVIAGVSFRAYRQKQKANREIETQKRIVEEKQKEVLDSIRYAQRIQSALLASGRVLNAQLGEHFILYKPKDIVSGDFYWAHAAGDAFYLAACDSTGHGVPGAFMSLLNIAFLNEAVAEKKLTAPNEVLEHVRKRLIENLSEDEGQDGMDGVLLRLSGDRLSYAAAHNAPFLIRNKELIELQADKMPVGKSPKESTPFAQHAIRLQPGDLLIACTDGYADQFGGEKGKKFRHKNLQQLILTHAHLPAEELKRRLEKAFEEWKGPLEQVDDVLVIGIRF